MSKIVFIVIRLFWLSSVLAGLSLPLLPPLQKTALPAKLADLPGGSNPVGDYHAIRVP